MDPCLLSLKSVTRGQMASFLDRAFDLDATGQDYFTDDEGRTFEGAVNRLRAAGIAWLHSDDVLPGSSGAQGPNGGLPPSSTCSITVAKSPVIDAMKARCRSRREARPIPAS